MAYKKILHPILQYKIFVVTYLILVYNFTGMVKQYFSCIVAMVFRRPRNDLAGSGGERL
jgi:hypothetical protein